MSYLIALFVPVIIWLIGLGVVLGGFIWAMTFVNKNPFKTNPAKIITYIGIAVIFVISLLPLGLYISSESFAREVKSAQTNYDPSSVTREMQVVSRAGDVIYETRGNFDIEYDDNRLRWVDEDGELNLIYLGDSATVLVHEIRDDESGSGSE